MRGSTRRIELSRRHVLQATGAALLTGAAASSPARALDLLGAAGAVDRAIPDAGSHTRWTRRWSAARRRLVEVGVALPPGTTSLAGTSVCVVLHGRGGTPRTALEDLGLGQFVAAAQQPGHRPVALVAVPGDTTYWHRRADGDDPAAMLWDEVLPWLADQGADVDRVGLWGWSMGGFGALLLAEQRPERISAVVASSAALWPRLQEATEGAFDGPADWQRHDVLARLDRLRGVPLRTDWGVEDRYAPMNRQLRVLLQGRDTDVLAREVAGGHTRGVWRWVAPAQAAWLSDAVGRST